MKRNILFCNKFSKVNLYILMLLIIIVNSLRKIYSQKNEINLVIKGKGKLYFLNSQFHISNYDLIINGESVHTSDNFYDFKNDLNNVTIKFNTQIKSCEKMFKGLYNIKEIDLSNFDSSKVTNMDSMFENCENLEKINFGKINTSLVNNMKYLFHYCYKLSSIDVSNFDTSSVTTINSIFRYCTSLTSINISNFNTKNMVDMLDIFAYCHKLTSADLSSFDTSKVTNMRGIFYQCYKLKRLDLRNFNTSSVKNIIGMFGQSNSLVYVNLYSFIIKNGVQIDTLFDHVSPNLKICINDSETREWLQTFYRNLNFDCSNICFKENIKIDLKSNNCIEQCNESEYKYEYNDYCYKKCPNATYIANNNKYFCLDKSIENNYYYDNHIQMYRECYNTCKRCTKGGNEINNNCIECRNGFMFINDSLYISNCYEICKYYYYFNGTNNYICTEDLKCPIEYNKLIKNKKRCIDECYKDDIYKYEYNNICYKKCPNGTNESNYICSDFETVNEKETYNKEIINSETNNIFSDFEKETYNTKIINSETNNIFFEFEKETYNTEIINRESNNLFSDFEKETYNTENINSESNNLFSDFEKETYNTKIINSEGGDLFSDFETLNKH